MVSNKTTIRGANNISSSWALTLPGAVPTANGQVLSATTAGVSSWADAASEGTDVKSTGESGGTKFLREDGDGTSSWQTLPASGAALTGSTDNTVCTVTGANAIQGEANLIFDGTSLGIGCTPSRELHVKGLDVALRLESTAATGRIGVEFYDTSAQKGFFGYASSSNDHMCIQQNEAADFYFYVNGADRLRINSSGYIAHHDSNIVTNGFGYHGWSGKTQILDSQGLAVYRTTDAWGGSIQLASSRGSYASPTASVDGIE